MLSRERMQERFLELVKIYSPSGGEKEQCQWLMDYFKERTSLFFPHPPRFNP